MPTEFGTLPIGCRFDCTIGGMEFVGHKVEPFRVLKPERTSFLTVNAFLLPMHKAIYGSEGFIASIPDALIVRTIAKAA